LLCLGRFSFGKQVATQLRPGPGLICAAPEADPAPFGCLATGSGSFPDQIPFELGNADENRHDHLPDMVVVLAQGSESDWNLPPAIAEEPV
jgi:hypothetical protein